MKKGQAKLPPMGLGFRIFSGVMFAAMAILLLAFIVFNPLALPFLSGAGTGGQDSIQAGEDVNRPTEPAQLYHAPCTRMSSNQLPGTALFAP